jgi:AraC-like DNA-binding protein/quercetin dioxygenase-like cupin family protein
MKSVLQLSKQKQSFKLPYTTTTLVKSRFFYVQTTGVIYTSKGYFVKRHNMDSLLLLYVLDGKGFLEYRGSGYDLTRHKLFIIDCMEEHKIRSNTDHPMTFCFVHFNGIQSREYVHIILEAHPCFFSNQDNREILKTIRSIILVVKRKRNHGEILCSRWIHSFLTDLLLKAEIRFSEHDSAPESIRRALDCIEDYYAEELSLEYMAEQAGMSKYHFTRMFKKYNGQTPYDYLLSFRLNKAKLMLINTNLQVGEIADKAGFKDLSHFTRTFKSHECMTALEYRKNFCSEGA